MIDPPVNKLYFDTNYLFRLYSTEPGAAVVQELANTMESIMIAWHGRAELFDTIYSNDRLVLAAAPIFGLKGVNVILA